MSLDFFDMKVAANRSMQQSWDTIICLTTNYTANAKTHNVACLDGNNSETDMTRSFRHVELHTGMQHPPTNRQARECGQRSFMYRLFRIQRCVGCGSRTDLRLPVVTEALPQENGQRQRQHESTTQTEIKHLLHTAVTARCWSDMSLPY
jgi:hypothetical protein